MLSHTLKILGLCRKEFKIKFVIPPYALLTLTWEGQNFLKSWNAFETDLLTLGGDSRLQDVLKVLAIGVEYSQQSPRSFALVSSYEPCLSVFEYQRLCNVLAGYKFAELLVLREELGSRVVESAAVTDLYLPPSTSTRNTPHVCSICMTRCVDISPLLSRHLKDSEIGRPFSVLSVKPSARIHIFLLILRSLTGPADFSSSCAY